jgi:predicted RNase H-like HicB family nuclease
MGTPGPIEWKILCYNRELRQERAAMKRQVRMAEVEEVGIRVRVESLENGRYVATSPDVPGLVAEGRSVAETVEIAQGLARKIVESCLEHGDPLPPIFRNKQRASQEFRVPVSVP